MREGVKEWWVVSPLPHIPVWVQRRRAEMNEEKEETQRKAQSKVHQLEEKNKV